MKKPHSSHPPASEVKCRDLESVVTHPDFKLNCLNDVLKGSSAHILTNPCSKTLVPTEQKHKGHHVVTGSMSPKNPPGRKRIKRTDEGCLTVHSPLIVTIIFDTFPWWILALEPSMVSHIYFPQHMSLQSLLSSLDAESRTFIEAVLDYLSPLEVSFGVTPRDGLTLLSGSFSYLKEILTSFPASMEFIAISTSMRKIRKLISFPHQLRRIQHKRVGGATNIELLWTSSRLDQMSLPASPLRRFVGDFLDFSIRPISIHYPPSFPHLHQASLLPPQNMECKVVYPSTFSHTGFGYRILTTIELGHIFGLPTTLCRAAPRHLFPMVPIQCLDLILLSFRNHANTSQHLHLRRESVFQLPSPVDPTASHWIPSIQKLLPLSWAQFEEKSKQAAKSDDALVNTSMWNLRIQSIWKSFTPTVLDKLRVLVLIKLKRSLLHEFTDFLFRKHGSAYMSYRRTRSNVYIKEFSARLGGMGVQLKSFQYSSANEKSSANFLVDLQAGRQVLHSYAASSFFGWDKGSTLIYWRWHPHLQHIARSGFTAAICKPLPHNKPKPKAPKKELYEKILSKLLKSLDRGYLIPTSKKSVKNLIDFFSVPKADDIRLVLNGSSCGLNEAVWAPNFWLPTSSSMTRVISFNYQAVDIDLGEMFLNFPLNDTLRLFSGMDLTPYQQDIRQRLPHLQYPDSDKLIVTNSRDWMGLKPSPEWACRFYYLAEEFVRGDESDPSNPLHWDSIVLNLIGNANFNPSLPNVFKWNAREKKLAGEIKAYVDDLRALGWDLNHAWLIAHMIASRLQYLGIQDAPRKRRLDNGPWAGTIYQTSASKIAKTVTPEKWQKAKDLISQVKLELSKSSDDGVDYKFLERVRGFLCHLAMTFDVIFPYLKGFHLTLCSYLPNRNEDGWKIKDLEWIGFLEQARESGKLSDQEIDDAMSFQYDPKWRPKRIKPVPRFFSCLKALEDFFSPSIPPVVTERSTEIHMLVYGFVDASKSGFGASLAYEKNVRYRIGTWGADEDDVSSNFREFANLVETLENEVEQKRIVNARVIMATDNSTVEAAIYKGNSTSEKLFNLVVRFKRLELISGSKFIVSHVSGKRMQRQGTDGISRGHLREGISLGECMLSFCPWGQSAIERHPQLKDWLASTFGSAFEFLQPRDWYGRGHDHDGGFRDHKNFYRLKIRAGHFFWIPPPAAADACIEEIRKARLKRRNSSHIVLIPRLATPLWLKQLNKAADMVLSIPCSHPFWPEHMFEPLILAFIFPHSKHYPWQLRATPKLLADHRKVSRLLQEDNVDAGSILRQLFQSTVRISSLPARLVRRLLFFGQQDVISHTSSRRPRKRRKLKTQ